MSDTNSNLSDETVELLQKCGEQADELEEEVTVEELIQHLGREFLDESEELSDEIAQRQKEFQERIFENV